MWSGRPKFRTSASIVVELTELLEEWENKKDVILGDASFSDIPEESKRIAKILKDFGIRWQANVRWSVNRELLEYFISCGCNRISVGLESGSDKVLKYIKKRCNKRVIKEKARMINSLGIKWHLFCVAGFPIETIEDMKETVELALEIAPTSISLNSMAPLPGTEVYKSIPGITPEFASTVNQLYPNYSFSEHMDTETYGDIFVKMTAVFDNYNKSKKQNSVR